MRAVRGYMTGSTSTSIWTQYAKGVRQYCGSALPEGLRKNDVLPRALVTPTTKAEDHDELISPQEVRRGARQHACAPGRGGAAADVARWTAFVSARRLWRAA